MATKRTAKRTLKDISFQKEGAHVALVSKEQGGPANGHDYSLILKSFDQEYIEKIQQVRVTMELPDFLQKFFYVYGSDAKILAYMMGYVEPADTAQDEKMEAESEFQDWIKERMDSFEVIKSLHESADPKLEVAKLSQEQYLALLKDQASLESILKKAEEGSTEAVAKAKESDDKTNAKVEPSGVTENQGNSMDEDQVTELTKSLEDTKAELTKALAKVAEFEAAQKEAIVKSKTAKLEAVVKNSEYTTVLAKAALALEADEDFDAFVATIEKMVAAVEKSELFKETGVSTDTEDVSSKESPVAKALKAQKLVK